MDGPTTTRRPVLKFQCTWIEQTNYVADDGNLNKTLFSAANMDNLKREALKRNKKKHIKISSWTLYSVSCPDLIPYLLYSSVHSVALAKQ